MARNRVGVQTDGDAEPPTGVESNGTTESVSLVREDATAALEQKRQKKQRELLRKKKAERRAHAKQRKQAQPEAVDAEETEVEQVATTDEAKTTIVAAGSDPREQDEPMPSTASLEGACAIEDHGETVAASDEPPRPSLDLTEAVVADPDSQTLEHPEQSSPSRVSNAVTLSDEGIESAASDPSLRPKKIKKLRPLDPVDDHAAATTIQKALKRSLLKKTRRTLQKAKSLLRHSSKILVDDAPPLVVPIPNTRPAIVPPLNLKPRSPIPSSHSPEDDSDASDASGSSSSEGSPTRTVSHRSCGSSCSSCGSCSSRSSSSLSSSSSSSGSARSPPRPRPKLKKTQGRNPPPLPSGPSIDMLLPRMPRDDPHVPVRTYSELHGYMATRIQARVRGMHGRARARQRELEFDREIRAEALREVQEEASVRIQAHVKGFLERRRLGLDEELPIASAHRRHPLSKHGQRDHHKHPHTKPNSVMPQSMVNATIGTTADDDEATVAEWPEEFNLESQDAWDELNSVMSPQHHGEPVTTAHFLSRGKLRVFCGTWNLHAKKPTDDLRVWIPSNKYHVVAVGTEECVHSIAKSVVFTSKKQWEDQLKDALGDEYVLVAAHSLTAIHNVVFVHESVLPYVRDIQSDAVATGLGNQLGNKGGVGIAFSIGRTSLAFVNCHFDAHQHNVAKRNANFHRINQELQLVPMTTAVETTTSTSQSASLGTVTGLGKTTTSRFSSSRAGSSSTLTAPAAAGSGAAAARLSTTVTTVRRRKLAISESFDRVFWYGDLNYRINGTRRMIDLLLLHNHHAVLRFNDQLRIEMAKGNVFPHFHEGPLHFRPTYKFDKHSNVYDSGPKQRIPSWTDRILFLSNEKPHDIELLSYRSHMNFQTSDHRPVGAVFQVNFTRNGPTRKKGEDAVDPTSAPTGGGGGGGDTGGGGGGGAEAQAFARVLAKGYKPNQTRSEVCVVQ